MKRDSFHAHWARIGGGFTVRPATRTVDLEHLIVTTAEASTADTRLFWVAASWLAVHHELVDARRLGRILDRVSEQASAITGALLDLARQEEPAASSLASARNHCRPLDPARPLFEIMADNPALEQLTRQEALPLFAQWGLWHNEITMKRDAIRPVQWVLAHCPELLVRAILGPGLDADVLQLLLDAPATVTDLSAVLHETRRATYAAVHEAVTRLVGRGLIRRERPEQRKKALVPTELALRVVRA
jgi:hypothetical protein